VYLFDKERADKNKIVVTKKEPPSESEKSLEHTLKHTNTQRKNGRTA
jgi:hypothetical protein